MTINQLKYITLCILIASLIRIFLINSNSIRQWLENRFEISTPLTSWSQVLEGIYLRRVISLSSTYEGDLVHELPIMLNFYEFLINIFKSENTNYIFLLFDVINSILVFVIVDKTIQYLIKLESIDDSKGKYQKLENRDTFLISDKTVNKNYWSLFAFTFYLFNVFSIVSCVAQSTVVIHNFILLLTLFNLLNGNFTISILCLSLHANITIYSIILLPGVLVLMNQKLNYIDFNGKQVKNVVVKYFTLFIVFTAGIIYLNLYIQDFNTRFIDCTYWFILTVPDLVPNLGLFWYFFIEMFDHFRVFFTWVFQMNVFLYSIPLTIRLQDNPIINLFIQIGIMSVLKSYPSLGETGLYISLLTTFAYLFPLMRNFLIYTCMLIASLTLAPIMLYLWIGSGGGNANFYFAITLVYSVGQIFLLVDVLYAFLKREFIKTNGSYVPKNKDGSFATFSLE